jgi:hypothetical protein
VQRVLAKPPLEEDVLAFVAAHAEHSANTPDPPDHRARYGRSIGSWSSG